MLGKSIHLQVIAQKSTKRHQILGYRHTKKTSGTFSRCHMSVNYNTSYLIKYLLYSKQIYLDQNTFAIFLQ